MRLVDRLKLFATLVVLYAGACVATNAMEPMRLQHEPETVLQFVAEQMNVTLRDDVPRPGIHVESETPLERYQEAVAPQWGFRPPRFSNVYVVATNEIYLTDDAKYYARLGRTLDESLAHEFAHYLQVRYLAGDLAEPSYEVDAVAVQSRFRDRLAEGPITAVQVAVVDAGTRDSVLPRTGRARRMLDATRLRGERFGALVRYAGGAVRANDARTLGRTVWGWVRARDSRRDA